MRVAAKASVLAAVTGPRLPACCSQLTYPAGYKDWKDRYGNEPRKGSDILIQALEREGVTQVFAYPGGASMEIHQALTRSDQITNILCRHEQVRIWERTGVRSELCHQ